MYFYNIVTCIISRVVYFFFARSRESKWASQRVRSLEVALGGRLDDATFHKIVNSYAIYNPVVCEAFTALRKRGSCDVEKERLLHYFICSSLFDNFCDRNELTQEALYQISFAPETYTPRCFDEQLFVQAHRFLWTQVVDKVSYQQAMQGVFQSQIDSLKQFDAAITAEDIRQITFRKGGYAVFLCHFYLDDPASEPEQQCWFQLGGIIQLINDLFDIYKDYQEGIATLPNRMTDAYAFYTGYMELVQNIKRTISQLPFAPAAKRYLTVSIIGICAVGATAIRQLQALQGDAERLPDLRRLPRKALIIDMEQPKNMWYCIRWIYRHARPQATVIQMSESRGAVAGVR
ncbi:MAG: hypothetical protein J7623_26220 [Chitinophaga sp.]|uniref:hypothetical protein n=1 Tax=Chitinophaga sp. TaxID=1869181 RepID=UPI001B1331CD|nr:hypothetical protein [Chitinophaga sp.]MBO9732165.1 hypothetical protein [Chitinophaga sp.]